jgi:hypothetical protein
MNSIAWEAERTGKKYHLLECRSRFEEEERIMGEEQKDGRQEGKKGRPFASEPEGLMTGTEIRAERKRRGIRGIDFTAMVGLGKCDLSNVESMAGRYIEYRKKIQEWFKAHPETELRIKNEELRIEEPEKKEEESMKKRLEARGQRPGQRGADGNLKDATTGEDHGLKTVPQEGYCCPVCGQEHNPNYKYNGLKIYDECCSCGLNISYYMPEHEWALSFLIEQLKVLSLQLDSMWRCRSK